MSSFVATMKIEKNFFQSLRVSVSLTDKIFSETEFKSKKTFELAAYHKDVHKKLTSLVNRKFTEDRYHYYRKTFYVHDRLRQERRVNCKQRRWKSVQSLNLTVQTVGKPDLNVLTDSERKSFIEKILQRIIRLSENSRAKRDWKNRWEKRKQKQKGGVEKKGTATASRDFRIGTEVG